ncbi:MAG: hypothetical protein ACRDFB_03375 [Rhabdochlamydiaceae bacterium]
MAQNNKNKIVSLLGGVTQTANKLGLAKSTVSAWKQIPGKHWLEILHVAKRERLPINIELLLGEIV